MTARYFIRRTLDLREYQVVDSWRNRPVVRVTVEATPGRKPEINELHSICRLLNPPTEP